MPHSCRLLLNHSKTTFDCAFILPDFESNLFLHNLWQFKVTRSRLKSPKFPVSQRNPIK